MTRLAAAALLALACAGCRLDSPPTSSEAAQAAAAQERAAQDGEEAGVPTEPQGGSDRIQEPPSALPPSPPPGLAFAVGREVLRLDADAVRAVERGTSAYNGAPTITIRMSDAAAAAFAELTAANVGHQGIITLDGDIVMTTAIVDRVSDGQLVLLSEAVDADVDGLLTRIQTATGTLPTV